MTYKNALLLLIHIFFLSSCAANDVNIRSNSLTSEDSKPQPYPELLMEDAIYKPSIRSVKIYNSTSSESQAQALLTPPFIQLGSNEQMMLLFDELDADIEDYDYTIIHCDAEWNQSDLYESDYIDGFRTLTIDEIDNSFNTVQEFIHYQIRFPNDMMKPSISGNYIIKVFSRDDEEDIILTRRFVVYEQLCRFKPNLKEPTMVSDRRFRQELDFEIVQAEYRIINAYDDLKVRLLQNNRWDNSIFGLDPVHVTGQSIIYDHDEENNFDGLNEFRSFDTKALGYVSVETERTYEQDGRWHIILRADEARGYKAYRTLFDINGDYIAKNDRFDNNLESEYVFVHFTLPFNYPVIDRSVHVIGEFTDWKATDENKMTWNNAQKRYELTMMLKQGYYNYQYAIFDGEEYDYKELEGNHFATQNDYTIIAYYHDIAGDYDRVIGILFL